MKALVDFRSLPPEARAKLAEHTYRRPGEKLRAMLFDADLCPTCGRGGPLTMAEATGGTKTLVELDEKLAALLLTGDEATASLELPRVRKALELAQREVRRLTADNDELRAALAKAAPKKGR